MSNNGSRVAGWVWILTPITVMAFVGFLYYLSSIPTDDEVIITQPSISKEEIIKPVLTEEQFEFYKLLENEEVKPPSQTPESLRRDLDTDQSIANDKSATQSSESFHKSLQAGSFINENDADQLKAKLILQGLDVEVKPVDIQGRTWHRVYVGPFANRSSLNSAQDTLAALDIAAIVITPPKD